MVSERRSYVATVVMDEVAGEGHSTREAATPVSMNRNSENQNFAPRSDEFDDPMYLHITENPNLIFVSPPMSENNYTSWSRSMKITLEVTNKFGFVNGAIPNLGEDDPKFAM